MARRHQRGWLKKETHREDETRILFFRTNRKSENKRLENKVPVGLVDWSRIFPAKTARGAKVE
jgi:hypothetical protein